MVDPLLDIDHGPLFDLIIEGDQNFAAAAEILYLAVDLGIVGQEMCIRDRGYPVLVCVVVAG